MKIHDRIFRRSSRTTATFGAAAMLFAVFASSANGQTWNNAGGDGLWFNGANWVGGVAPTGTGDDAVVGAPAPATVNGSVDLNSLTVDANGVVNINPGLDFNFGGTATTTLNNAGTINVGNNSDFQFQGTVINSGNTNVNAAGSNTDIEVDSIGATLDGGGTVTLTGGLAGINGLGGSTLTVVDQTIQGQGRIGENSIGIVNQANGLIDANVNTALLELDVSAAGMTNSGTIQASGGGIMQVLNSVVDNTGGQIVAQTGSQVRLGGADITGGTLATVGSGQLSIDNSTNVGFNNLTLNGNLVSQNNSDTEISGTITNNGTMTIASTGSNTDIEVQAGGATLTGSGKVTLSGDLAGINGAGTLTIGTHTIEGEGSLGENAIGIVNSSNGVVDANVASKLLSIDANADGLDNDGVLKATNEGILRIIGSNVDNAGGLIEADNDSTVELNSATVSGGTINSNGTGQVNIANSTSVRLENLSTTGNIVSQNNSDTEVLGTINNTGQIELISTGSNTDIEVQTGNATLTGGGTVKLNGPLAGINGAGGSVLTIGDQTIEGEGTLGENAIGIVNSANGLVDANVAGSLLTIDADATNNFINNGTLRASSGATLRITGTDLTNNNVVEALDASKVELNSSTITGGTVRSTGTGIVELLASTSSRLVDTTIEGNLQSLNNSDTEILGTINNTGLIDVLAAGSNTDIEVQTGDATLTGGGTVKLDGVLAGINGASGSILTIGDQTIEGEGSVGENTIGIVNSASGLIDANVSGRRLTVDADSTNHLVNDGTMRATDGGFLQINGTTVANNNVIEALDSSKVELLSSTITGGTIRSTGSGLTEVLASSTSRLQDVTIEGRLNSLNNSDTDVVGTINNTGTFEVLATGSNTDIEVQTGDATFTGGGTVRLSGTLAGINGVSGSTLTIDDQLVIGQGNIGENTIGIFLGSAGTVEADIFGGSLIIDAAGSMGLSNDGILRASNGGLLDVRHALTNNGIIDTEAGSTVVLGDLTSTIGSLLSGEGMIDVASGLIMVDGTVAPGSSAGTLTFLDDTMFSASALLEAELESASLFDVLSVQGDLTLDGNLELDLLGGFDPLSSDSFLIASATGNLFGEFANVGDGGMLLTQGGEGTFVVNYLSNGVLLSNFSANAIPEPGSLACLFAIGIGVLLRRRRTA